MLETFMKQQVIFYAMGIVAGIGVLSKVISHITLRRMVRAASQMNKSNHKLMRLVKAKFEHASMISDKVQNVEAFVKKYIYEYRVFGIRLSLWREMEKKCVWIIGVLGALGAAAAYQSYGLGERAYQYGIWGVIGAVTLFLIHISTNERNYLEAAENYMVEFLENVCIHRYTRVCQPKEMLQETVLPMEEDFIDPPKEEEPVMEPEKEVIEEKVTQEVQIRKILEEFLA